jgi:hypothetical protein
MTFQPDPKIPWCGCESCRLDREDVPFLGHAFEGVDPPILETDAGARHQILHGRGDDHLIGAGERGQAGGDGDGDAAHVVAEQLDLAGVQACPDMQAQRRDITLNRPDAADGTGRAVEGGQQPGEGDGGEDAISAGSLGGACTRSGCEAATSMHSCPA